MECVPWNFRTVWKHWKYEKDGRRSSQNTPVNGPSHLTGQILDHHAQGPNIPLSESLTSINSHSCSALFINSLQSDSEHYLIASMDTEKTMEWMCTECTSMNSEFWQKDCWACGERKRDNCRWFFPDGREMIGAEATYEQELKVQKEAAQAAQAAKVPGAKSPPPLPPGHRGVVEPKGSSTSAKPKPVPPLRSPPATEASKAAKAVEASKASQAAESSKSSKAKAVEEQMLADAKAKLIKGKSSNDRVQWTTSRISEMKRINALNLEPAQLKSPAQPEVSTEEEEVSEFSWVRLNRTQERLKRRRQLF